MPLQTQNTGGALLASTLATINLCAAGIFPTQGNIFFVEPFIGDDNAPGTVSQPLKTLATALAMCTAGNNDIVYFLAHSNTAAQTTDYQTANLNWNKSLTHLIGVNCGPFLGQRSRVSNLSTANGFTGLLTVSANGCLIANMEFFQGGGATVPAASTCVLVSGQRNRFVNCQISGVGHADLDQVGSNDLTITGSENIFQHCYIGLDTIIRATCVTGIVISGTPARTTFENCHVDCWTSATTYKLVSIATGVDRWVKFKDCEFQAATNISSAVAPTGAIGITTMNGQVLVMNCGFFGITQVVTADNAYVQQLGFNGVATGHLVGISQGIDAA